MTGIVKQVYEEPEESTGIAPVDLVVLNRVEVNEKDFVRCLRDEAAKKEYSVGLMFALAEAANEAGLRGGKLVKIEKDRDMYSCRYRYDLIGYWING